MIQSAAVYEFTIEVCGLIYIYALDLVLLFCNFDIIRALLVNLQS